MSVHPWTEISSEAFTEEAIRGLFPVSEGHRFFPNRYNAGVKFSGSLSRPGRVYVFEGGCTYHTEAGPVHVKAGEYADLLPGQYDFEVPVESPVRLMKVYKLAELAGKAS